MVNLRNLLPRPVESAAVPVLDPVLDLEDPQDRRRLSRTLLHPIPALPRSPDPRLLPTSTRARCWAQTSRFP